MMKLIFGILYIVYLPILFLESILVSVISFFTNRTQEVEDAVYSVLSYKPMYSLQIENETNNRYGGKLKTITGKIHSRDVIPALRYLEFEHGIVESFWMDSDENSSNGSRRRFYKKVAGKRILTRIPSQTISSKIRMAWNYKHQ
jgi:DNA-binding PadR family transcriptional regulator